MQKCIFALAELQECLKGYPDEPSIFTDPLAAERFEWVYDQWKKRSLVDRAISCERQLAKGNFLGVIAATRFSLLVLFASMGYPPWTLMTQDWPCHETCTQE